MTDSTPVSRITLTLEAAGYHRIANELRIGNLKFDFPAAFVPKENSAELILVADSTDEPEDVLRRKVDSVARALDVSQSMRSLTLVVTGPRPSDATLESLSRVCRVLPTGSISGPEGETVLRNWLAVLLPLNLPQAEAVAANPLARVYVSAEALDDAAKTLIKMALQGQAAVKSALYETIDEAVRTGQEKNA